jgi:hypothetical protein
MRRLLLFWGLLSPLGCATGEDDNLLDDTEIVEEWGEAPEAEEPPPPELAESPRALPLLSAPACSQEKLAEVLAPATEDSRAVWVSCHLSLGAGDVVTRQIIVEGAAASGTTIDCRGAHLDGGAGRANAGRDMIEIRSRRGGDGTWSRPEDVTVRDCRITGSMRI